MTEFKIGDRARIVGNTSGHSFKVGVNQELRN